MNEIISGDYFYKIERYYVAKDYIRFYELL